MIEIRNKYIDMSLEKTRKRIDFSNIEFDSTKKQKESSDKMLVDIKDEFTLNSLKKQMQFDMECKEVKCEFLVLKYDRCKRYNRIRNV